MDAFLADDSRLLFGAPDPDEAERRVQVRQDGFSNAREVILSRETGMTSGSFSKTDTPALEYIGGVLGLYPRMALIGRLHPLLVHFPIALILIAAVAELLAMATRTREWRAVAVANLRAGAAFAVASTAAGWLLASSRIVEASPSLESHRWLGTYAAVLAIAAACTTGRVVSRPSQRLTWAYRVAVFCAAGLVGVAGHFGAVLVWGADFLRP